MTTSHTVTAREAAREYREQARKLTLARILPFELFAPTGVNAQDPDLCEMALASVMETEGAIL